MNTDEALDIDLRKRLHDGLCQQLTAALMFSDALRRTLHERNAEEAEDCEKLVAILQRSANELIDVMNLVSERRL